MKASNVLDIAYETIKKYNMLNQGDKVVVGVSGGPDSLCLLHLLNHLQHEFDIELYAAHVNHGLRGESADQDERFVQDFAEDLGIPVLVKHINIKDYAKRNKATLEEAGREARYIFFNEILTKVNAHKIAVGHNMNDSVETLLLNLIRGSGVDGLKGIEPFRGSIIRPLIKVSRGEIEQYCNQNHLAPRLDESNAENIFTRNRIRLDLIPYLERNFNPNVVDSLSRTAQLIYDENAFLHNLSKHYYSECLLQSGDNIIKFSKERFNNLHDAVKRRVLRLAIEKLKGDLRAVEKVHIDQAMDLSSKGRTGTWVKVPKDIIVTVEYNQLIFMKRTPKNEISYSYKILIPGEVEIPEVKARLIVTKVDIKDIDSVKRSKFICLLDNDELNKYLTKLRTQDSELGTFCIRNRRNGDIITPSGMKGSKKLKDYFIDEKISREERILISLAAVGNEVIWIIGKRYSERFKITNKTKEVLVLEYKIGE